MLDELNGLVLAGELALERLERAETSRLFALGRPFDDAFELAAFLSGRLRAEGFTASEGLGRTDVLFALLCGDVSAPVTFGVNRFGWAPTVQLTAFLRARPADGWLRVLCTTTQIGQEWFDEDHVVVDSAGRIVVQSRQLALVPPP